MAALTFMAAVGCGEEHGLEKLPPAAATLPPLSERVFFAAIGDYGSAGVHEGEVANLVSGMDPEFVITLGDNNYPGGSRSTIDVSLQQRPSMQLIRQNECNRSPARPLQFIEVRPPTGATHMRNEPATRSRHMSQGRTVLIAVSATFALFGCSGTKTTASLAPGSRVALTLSPGSGGMTVSEVKEIGGDEEAAGGEGSDSNEQVNCENGIDPATGKACDGGPQANANDGSQDDILDVGNHPEGLTALGLDGTNVAQRGQRLVGSYLGNHRFQVQKIAGSKGLRFRVVTRLQEVRRGSDGNVVLRVLDHDLSVNPDLTVGEAKSGAEELDVGAERDQVDCQQNGNQQGDNVGC